MTELFLIRAHKHPLIILTPPPTAAQPSAHGIALLGSQCRELIASGELFSVTNISDEAKDPARSKNHFFSQSPYWWPLGDGTWEHRDGQRNLAADAIKCQDQLERMSIIVNTLALGYKYLINPGQANLQFACKVRAEELLEAFFTDGRTRMLPEVEYSQCIPGRLPLKGNESFVIATRYLILVAQALLFLPTTSFVRKHHWAEWFEAHIAWMRSSPQGQEAAKLDKKMSRWYHAALASYLRISHPDESRLHAKTILRQLISDDPDPAETIFGPDSRYYQNARPRHVSMFSLEPLFILAALTIPSSHLDKPNPLTSQTPLSPEMTTAPLVSPPGYVLDWLELFVDCVERVKPGPHEVLAETDERQTAKLAFFRRTLMRWRTGSVEQVELDGSLWEKGWRDWSKLSWEMI